MRMRESLCLGLLFLTTSFTAWGWGAIGHRVITYLALDALPAEAPAFLRELPIRDRVADHSITPDRWRSFDSDMLGHAHKMDHFIDAEDLVDFGLSLENLPRLKYEYLRVLVLAKDKHPEKFASYDPARDRDRTREWPGLAPYAIAEEYAKLQASFLTYRLIEQQHDYRRTGQLEQARENILYHMGILSHYVADLAQPLHSTKHYNGWVGENPKNYTTSNKFHSYIDSNIVESHKLSYEMLRPAMAYKLKIKASDPWEDILAYIRRSYACVEPLYQIEHDGDLHGELGKQFLSDRFIEAGEMLGALYAGAWASSVPNRKQEADFVTYDRFIHFTPPKSANPAAATQPAGSPPAASQPTVGATAASQPIAP